MLKARFKMKFQAAFFSAALSAFFDQCESRVYFLEALFGAGQKEIRTNLDCHIIWLANNKHLCR